MKNTRILLIGCALFAAVGFGCDDSSKDVATVPPCGGECTDGKVCNAATNTCEEPALLECLKDKDCKGDFVCENKKCICPNSDACPGNLVCKAGDCVPECTNSDECEGDWVCRNQQCKPECESRNDCSGFLVCRAEHCVPECETADDCVPLGGDVCRNGQCRSGCVDGDDCPSGICDNEACLECQFDADCAGNSNGPFCIENNCVECERDEQCAGTGVCVGHACEPACRSNAQCAEKDSTLPYCLDDAENDYLNAVCVECTDQSQCEGNKICVDNACKFECERDLDCSDDKKCDPTDNHCYVCVSSADCGTNQACDHHVCETCEDGDSDCDGVPDDVDGCPYNPNVMDPVSETPDYDCNYVTDADGTRVFEIWNANDFERLNAEILNANLPVEPDPCNVPEEGAELTIGDCCDAAEYVDSCSDGKLLSCTAAGVVEQTCEYGCDGDACARCIEHEDGNDYSVGECCFNDFVTVCDENRLQLCDNGKVVESVCDYGCDGASCRLCNEPADESKLVVGDCCDPMKYVPSCQADGQSKIECVGGVVVVNDCADCLLLDNKQFACKPKPSTKFKVRIMNDINLADAADDGDIVDVAFESLSVPWRESVTGEDGEVSEVVHTPGESGYKAFDIPDATCVMRWQPVSLMNVYLDGQNHRIFFKNASGESCSLVDPLFSDVGSSVVESLSLNYNMRGLARSMFASSVQNSVLTGIHFAGNVNLEKKPILGESNEGAYVSGSVILINTYYEFGVVNAPHSGSTSNYFKDIRFKGNVTQSTSYHLMSVSDYKSVPGFEGLFGVLKDSFVSDSSVVVPDYALSDNRMFFGWAYNIDNSRILSPVSEIAWIGTASTNGDSYVISPFAYEMNNDIISNGIISHIGDVRSNKMNNVSYHVSYYDLAYRINNTKSFGDLQMKTGSVTDMSNYYGFSRYWVDSKHNGNIVAKRGSAVVYDNYYGFGDYLDGLTVYGDVSLTLSGNAEGRSLQCRSYFGVAYNPKNSGINGTLTIRTQDLDALSDKDNHYYGVGCEGEKFNLKDVDIQVGNLKYRNYFGVFKNSGDSSITGTTKIVTGNHTSQDSYIGLSYGVQKLSVGDLTIKIGDVIAPLFYYGLGVEISPNAIMLNGETIIMQDNANCKEDSRSKMTGMGRFYGLARKIKGNCKNVTIKLGDIEQTYDGRALPSGEGSNYFSGLANAAFSDQDTVISNIRLDVCNIKSPLYTCPLINECRHENSNAENKIVVDGVTVSTGDITIGTSAYHGDFDDICRELNMTVKNVVAKYGNVYVLGGFDSFGLVRTLHPKGILQNIKYELDGLIAETNSKFGMISNLSGKVENVAVLVRHLQTDSREYSAITTIYENAEIKNMVYYADVYVKTPIAAGFANKISSANVSLENIFSAARINKYENVDATTHKAKDGVVYYGHPLLFNYSSLPSGSVTLVDADVNPPRYLLNLAKIKNVFWLKRDAQDSPLESNRDYMTLDGEAQFPAFEVDAVEFALQSGGSDLISPANTLSGCENAASCGSPWAPLSGMKVIKEPHGGTVYIPWMK